MYYLFIIALQLWYLFWLIWYVSVKFDFAVAIVAALEIIIYFLLWLLVPYVLSMKNEVFINNTGMLLRLLLIRRPLPFDCLSLLILPSLYSNHIESSSERLVEYAEKQKTYLFKVLCIAYFFVFLLVLAPQIAYYSMMEVPYLRDHVSKALPWSTDQGFVVCPSWFH